MHAFARRNTFYVRKNLNDNEIIWLNYRAKRNYCLLYY